MARTLATSQPPADGFSAASQATFAAIPDRIYGFFGVAAAAGAPAWGFCACSAFNSR